MIDDVGMRFVGRPVPEMELLIVGLGDQLALSNLHATTAPTGRTVAVGQQVSQISRLM